MRVLTLLGGVVCMLATLVGCAGSPAGAVNAKAPKGTGFSVCDLTLGDGTKTKYSLFVPYSYKPGTPTRAIVFLHGIGEGGSNGVKNTTVGLGPAIGSDPEAWPVIAVFPQTSSGKWKSEHDQSIAIAALDDASKRVSIDPKRVALTGLSTGGEGVWRIAASYPSRFDRLAPMAAYEADDIIDKLPRVPIWAVHCPVDIFVSYSGSKSMVNKINERGGNARLSDWGGSLNPHNCWDKAYSDAEFRSWIQGR
ncbi:MAG: hypothetical protein QM770_11020 [Tepidisphaeraceae bacterium]